MPKSQRFLGWLLTAGAATFAVYVLTHPHGAVDRAATVKDAVHSMAVEASWVPTHVVGLAAVVMIGFALWGLLRSRWLSDDPRPRRAALLLVVGAVAAAAELVPHTLVASETAELAAGGSTPVTNLHLLFQAVLFPLYGLAVAALAATGFGRVAHPVACVLGVIGGAALTVVGPLLLVTGEPGLGVLFMPGVGTIVFLLAVGVRLARSEVQRPAFATS